MVAKTKPVDVDGLKKICLRRGKNAAHRALEQLEKLSGRRRKSRSEAIAALREIMVEAPLQGIRLYAGFRLADVAEAGDEAATAFFLGLLDQPEHLYVCAKGLLKTIGPDAYPHIVEIVNDSKLDVLQRYDVVAVLAEHCHCPFDRNLAIGEARKNATEADLLLDEINAWAKNGFVATAPEPCTFPVSDLKQLGVVLPTDYQAFLSQHHQGDVYFNLNRNWYLTTADQLVETISIDRREVAQIRQLEAMVRTLAEVLEGDATRDDKGRPFSLERLAAGLTIGSDDSGDLLFLDPLSHHSVWIYHHDGGDVTQVADAFGDWLKRAKKN